jgi:hypothetical protein
MVDEKIPPRKDFEEVLDTFQPRLRHGGPGIVLELWTLELVEGPERRRIEESFRHVNLVGQEPELARQECPDLVGGRGVELEPNRGRAPEAAPQDGLDGFEQIPSFFLLQLEVGITGEAEARVVHDLHPREQDIQVRSDDLLDGDEPLTVRHLDEPGEQRRDLDAREAPFPAGRVPDEGCEVERQRRDVGERMRRIDREWREHREDPLAEQLAEVLSVGGVELGPTHEPHSLLLERRPEVVDPQRVRAAVELRHPFRDASELFLRRQSLG